MKCNVYFTMAFAFMTIYVCQAETLGEKMIFKDSSTEFSIVPKTGKWVPEYGGGSTPLRCVCADSLTNSDCLVGDITSKTSLCE